MTTPNKGKGKRVRGTPPSKLAGMKAANPPIQSPATATAATATPDSSQIDSKTPADNVTVTPTSPPVTTAAATSAAPNLPVEKDDRPASEKALASLASGWKKFVDGSKAVGSFIADRTIGVIGGWAVGMVGEAAALWKAPSQAEKWMNGGKPERTAAGFAARAGTFVAVLVLGAPLIVLRAIGSTFQGLIGGISSVADSADKNKNEMLFNILDGLGRISLVGPTLGALGAMWKSYSSSWSVYINSMKLANAQHGSGAAFATFVVGGLGMIAGTFVALWRGAQGFYDGATKGIQNINQKDNEKNKWQYHTQPEIVESDKLKKRIAEIQAEKTVGTTQSKSAASSATSTISSSPPASPAQNTPTIEAAKKPESKPITPQPTKQGTAFASAATASAAASISLESSKAAPMLSTAASTSLTAATPIQQQPQVQRTQLSEDDKKHLEDNKIAFKESYDEKSKLHSVNLTSNDPKNIKEGLIQLGVLTPPGSSSTWYLSDKNFTVKDVEELLKEIDNKRGDKMTPVADKVYIGKQVYYVIDNKLSDKPKHDLASESPGIDIKKKPA